MQLFGIFLVSLYAFITWMHFRFRRKMMHPGFVTRRSRKSWPSLIKCSLNLLQFCNFLFRSKAESCLGIQRALTLWKCRYLWMMVFTIPTDRCVSSASYPSIVKNQAFHSLNVHGNDCSWLGATSAGIVIHGRTTFKAFAPKCFIAAKSFITVLCLKSFVNITLGFTLSFTRNFIITRCSMFELRLHVILLNLWLMWPANQCCQALIGDTCNFIMTNRIHSNLPLCSWD